MKPTLYIMCGLPYSGKTMLAQSMSKQQNLPVVSIDAIREERDLSWEDNERVTKADWDTIFAEVYTRLAQHLDAGQSVIYDSANQDRASRDELRAFAIQHHSNTQVIYLDVPIETSMSRWQQNQATKKRFHLPKKWLQAAIDTLEPPTVDENVTSIPSEPSR